LSPTLIPAAEEFTKSFVESIYYGNYDYLDFIEQKNTRVRNGNPYNRRDFIYERLINDFSADRYHSRTVSSGNWQEHLQIIDKENKTLYIVANAEKVHTLRVTQNLNRTPHYVEAYCLINKPYGKIDVFTNSGQLCLDLEVENAGNNDSLIGEWHYQKNTKLMELIGQLEIKTFVLIPILIKNNKLVEVKMLIPGPDIQNEYFYTEDLSHLIPVEYKHVIETEIVAQGEEMEIPLGIKKSILEKDSVDPVLKKVKQKGELG